MSHFLILKFSLVGILCIYRKDRNIHGGGVFILVDESIPSSVIEVDSLCEIIWVHLHVQKTMDMILG